MATLPASPAVGSDRKPKRLTFACNTCRSRKVKCDVRQPKCSNCLKAGTECLTTDPRHPGQIAKRTEAQSLSPHSPVHSTTSGSGNITNSHGQSGLLSSQTQQTPWAFQLETSDQDGELNRESRLPTPISAATVAKAPLPVLPRFMSGNSLRLLNQWLVLAFTRIGVSKRLLSTYMIDPVASKSSKFSPLLGLRQSFPRFNFDIKNYAEYFLSSVNITFPIFDAAVVYDLLQSHADASLQEGYQRELSSSSAVSMLLIAIAGSCDRDREVQMILDHVRGAYSLLSIFITEASLRSVQALFFMALVLRGHNEIDMAWHLIVLAVSIAQSLGMHRAFTPRHRQKLGEALSEEYVRTWWATYSLEKVLSLEIERHSSIRDSECNQSSPVLDQNPPVFLSLIKLAQVQSRINERCIQARCSEEDPKVEYQDVIREKIINAGELDQMLVAWDEDLPNELRPSNYLFCDPRLLPSVSFLAIQYHQTLVLLHRNNLLVNLQQAHKEIDHFCFDKPYLHRLRNGQTICGNAARSIVGTLDNAYAHQGDSILNTINAPLIAAYALAIHSLRHPSSGLAKADLELQARAIQLVHVQQAFVQDYDAKLDELLCSLQSQVAAVVEAANSGGGFNHLTPAVQTVQNRGFAQDQQSISNLSQPQPDQNFSNQAQLMFEMPNDPASQMFFQPMYWPDLYGHNLASPNDELDVTEIDWDAVALAFGLPS